jgi:DNA-binding GntR family transcriptional regulator
LSIVYKNLNQLVYEQLRSEILQGKLPPGTRIKQEELTQRLGVSRTPVRESIHRLEMEGLVEFERRNSVLVSRISRNRIEEVFELRAVLEGYAAEKAAERITEEDTKKLRKFIAEMDACHSKQQIERLLSKNDEFHRFICSRAGNEVLLEMLEQIWRDIKRLRINYLITPEGHEESTREHESLVDAIESHDKKRIRQIVQKHSESSKKGILATLGSTAEVS